MTIRTLRLAGHSTHRRRSARRLGLCAALLGLAATTSAQTLIAGQHVAEGDTVAGLGQVTHFEELTVSDQGLIVLEVGTTDDLVAILFQGNPGRFEGEPVVVPNGSVIAAFDSLSLDQGNGLAWILALEGAPSLPTSGVYSDGGGSNAPVVLQGDVSTAAAFSPGTTYVAFAEVVGGAPGELLVSAWVDDPALPSSLDRALVRFDGAETVVVKEGDVLPGLTDAVADLAAGPHALAMDGSGRTAYVALLEGDPAADTVVVVDGVVVAREGEPSPLAGRAWADLADAAIDLDEAGGWALRGRVAGDPATDELIVVDGVVAVQEGDVLPGTGGHPVTGLGSGPVYLAADGQLVWYGEWAELDPDRDSGLFVGDTLLVQEGIHGIDGFRGVEGGFELSPDGEWLVFLCDIDDGTEEVRRLRLSPWAFLGQGLPGVGNETPRLIGNGSLAFGGNLLELLDARPGAPTTLILGASAWQVPLKGGVLVPALDVVLPGLLVDAEGAVTITGSLPLGVPSGLEFWAQYWTVDPDAVAGLSASTAVSFVTP